MTPWRAEKTSGTAINDNSRAQTCHQRVSSASLATAHPYLPSPDPYVTTKLPNCPPPSPNLAPYDAPRRQTTAPERLRMTTFDRELLLGRPVPKAQPAKQPTHQGSRRIVFPMGWPVTSPQASSIRPPHRCRVKTAVLQGLRLKA